MAEITIIKEFDSPLDFLEWASNAPVLWKNTDLASRATGLGKSEWTGTRNYEEAYALAKFGWKDGLKMLTEKVELANAALAAKIAPRKQEKRYDVAGYYPNPPRAAAGEIFSMVQPLRPKAADYGNFVKIRYDIGRVHTVDTSTIINMGAALCSYINALEKSGRVVHLEAYHEFNPTYGPGAPLSFRFPLKKAGYNLSMADIIFWIVHPSALRRISFAAMEKLDIQYLYEGGYGKPACITSPPSDTLYLRIDDAGDNIKSCLENIRQKHIEILQPESVLKAQLEMLKFG